MGTTHLSGLQVGGIPTFGIGGAPMFTGTWYFVDAVNGANGNDGSASKPLATVYSAYSRMTSGANDVCVVVGNGAASGSQRLSLANAVASDSAATTGTLTWAKNACHLIGMAAPGPESRARFAPPTGTYTQATFNSGNFVTVSASGCYFANISLFHGFSTGGNNQICWTDSGGRNYYYNMAFGGAGDAASAQSTSSRSMLITGTTGANTFESCQFGLDTVTRTVANSTLEFAAGSPRNTFKNCTFPFQTSAATVLGFIGSAAACVDRWQTFDNCSFINNVQSTSTTMNGLGTLAASAGGLLMMKNCTLVGVTEYGTDVTTRGQVYIDGGTVTAATSGIAVNPT